MSEKPTSEASQHETDYIHALSRESVVAAYANWKELSEIERHCLDLFLKDGDAVLDLGCGVGRIPRLLGSRMGRYLGIDCSPQMVREAKRLNPRYEFWCEDFLNVCMKGMLFNVILLMNNVLDMLHPIERRMQTFELAKELLVSPGVLIYSSHLLHNNQVPGYYSEEYHSAVVNTYRSSMGYLCNEAESHGFNILLVARDYRSQIRIADWVYIVASKESLLTCIRE